VLGPYFTGNTWLGGAVVALIHGVACIEFGAIHAISGLGLNMFALGLTTFLCAAIFKSNISPGVPALNNMTWAQSIPVIGPVLYQLSPLVLVAVASYMALGQLDRFVKGMLAVIAVKMGRWNPVGIMGTALLLGLFDAIQLQFNSAISIPPELIQILPFVAGIVVLSLQQSGNDRPAALDATYLRNKYKF
jgi:Uncharacterized ABC-type transport system, permease component